MSTQKGNAERNRGQRYQNAKKFKNNLHDTNKRSLAVNGLTVADCCERCTEIIEWKIKYKKYKTLTVPKKCIKCSQKSVKRAYCVVCHQCVVKLNICAKCNQIKDIVVPGGLTEEEKAKQMSQLEQELKLLPERKRRALMRLQASGKLTEDMGAPLGLGCGDADDSDDPLDSEDAEDCEDEISLDDSDEGEPGDQSGNIETGFGSDEAATQILSDGICQPMGSVNGDKCETEARELTELDKGNSNKSSDGSHGCVNESDKAIHNLVDETANLCV